MTQKHHVEVRVMIVVDGACYDETRTGGVSTLAEMATGERADVYAEVIRESLIRLHAALSRQTKDPTP